MLDSDWLFSKFAELNHLLKSSPRIVAPLMLHANVDPSAGIEILSQPKPSATVLALRKSVSCHLHLDVLAASVQMKVQALSAFLGEPREDYPLDGI